MFKGSYWEPRVCSLRDSGTKWPSLFTPVVVCGGSGKVTWPGGGPGSGFCRLRTVDTQPPHARTLVTKCS